jgi:hypothetical protein
MPFSVVTTKHVVFMPTASGGTQMVIVTNADRKQIALVFSDPAAIHGSAMRARVVAAQPWQRTRELRRCSRR